MRYTAVLFDLFGTLVDNYSPADFRRELAEMASALRLPAEEFAERWLHSTHEAWLGSFPDTGAKIQHICEVMGMNVESDSVLLAAKLRLEGERRHLIPRPDAYATLTALRAAGFRTGLISNTMGDVPRLWKELGVASLIDEAVFSCEVGLEKPDVRIYHLACARLATRPEECIFVGDGGSDELSGAARAGLTPIRSRTPHEQPIPEDRWNGITLSSLSDILRQIG